MFLERSAAPFGHPIRTTMCPSAARSGGAVAKSTVSALALKCGQLWPPTVTLAIFFPVANAGARTRSRTPPGGQREALARVRLPVDPWLAPFLHTS